MKALRVMAGHGENKGCVEVKRDGIEPCEYLKNLIFPWIEKGMLQIQGSSHITAKAFLRYMKNMCSIILQDAACMVLLGRLDHCMWELEVELEGFPEKIKVFKTSQFLAFVQEMKLHLSTGETLHVCLHVCIYRYAISVK